MHRTEAAAARPVYRARGTIAAPYERALAAAIAEHLAALKTEPLTVGEIARLFDVHRNKAAAIVKRIEGVERCGRRFRIPLVAMPPTYHVEHGLLPPT